MREGDLMETQSLFFKGNPVKSFDENGQPAQGTRLTSDNIIVRFKDGYLDGDSIDSQGNIIVQPAVETEGHIEYWRKGVPHRDDELPAISTKGFSDHEFWCNGERLK